MNCAGSSYCQIIGWSLTMNFFWEPSEIFKLLGMIETLFTYLWSCGCLRWRWWWIYSHGCELENMFLILTSEIIQTLLRRTFDGVPLRFNGWSRSWFKIMLWSWGPFVCQETNLFICVMKLSGLQVLDLLARKLWNFLLRNGIAWQLW